MKKIFLLSLFLVFVFLPAKTWAAERITSFDLEFRINKDSSVDVTEKIEYDFDNLQKHGIYRNIPVKYKARGGNYSLRLSEISVTDEDGLPYTFSESFSGDDVVLKIGDANFFVTGKKTYVIKYKVKRALNFFDDHDEFYWNAIGSEWDVEIDNVRAKVILPDGVESVRSDCFVGHIGSVERCSHLQDKNTISFSSRNLLPNEVVTVVVGFAKGTVIEPTQREKIMETIRDNWILGAPLITLLIMLYLWKSQGKDPKGRGTIIAQFSVPDNLSPLEVGTLVDEMTQDKDLSAQIISLAVRGYLRIKRIETGALIFKGKDYELTKLKDEFDLKEGFDREIMEGIFEGGKAETIVKMSSLKNKFYENASRAAKSVYLSLVKKGYFPKNPNSIRSFYLMGGFAIFFVGIISGGILGGLAVISLCISGFVVIGFSFLMPKKTQKGVLAWEHVLGLKLYMSVAEKDRMEFHNAPNKNPKHFEELLPYAMVLGVTKQWAEQFKDIYVQEPDWYSSGVVGGFVVTDFANDLGGFCTTTKSVSSLASSGGSGFSGGGGGGFGGGGGGSW